VHHISRHLTSDRFIVLGLGIQSAYRKGHSTETALLRSVLTSFWRARGVPVPSSVRSHWTELNWTDMRRGNEFWIFDEFWPMCVRRVGLTANQRLTASSVQFSSVEFTCVRLTSFATNSLLSRRAYNPLVDTKLHWSVAEAHCVWSRFLAWTRPGVEPGTCRSQVRRPATAIQKRF